MRGPSASESALRILAAAVALLASGCLSGPQGFDVPIQPVPTDLYEPSPYCADQATLLRQPNAYSMMPVNGTRNEYVFGNESWAGIPTVTYSQYGMVSVRSVSWEKSRGGSVRTLDAFFHDGNAHVTAKYPSRTSREQMESDFGTFARDFIDAPQEVLERHARNLTDFRIQEADGRITHFAVVSGPFDSQGFLEARSRGGAPAERFSNGSSGILGDIFLAWGDEWTAAVRPPIRTATKTLADSEIFLRVTFRDLAEWHRRGHSHLPNASLVPMVAETFEDLGLGPPQYVAEDDWFGLSRKPCPTSTP